MRALTRHLLGQPGTVRTSQASSVAFNSNFTVDQKSFLTNHTRIRMATHSLDGLRYRAWFMSASEIKLVPSEPVTNGITQSMSADLRSNSSNTLLDIGRPLSLLSIKPSAIGCQASSSEATYPPIAIRTIPQNITPTRVISRSDTEARARKTTPVPKNASRRKTLVLKKSFIKFPKCKMITRRCAPEMRGLSRSSVSTIPDSLPTKVE